MKEQTFGIEVEMKRELLDVVPDGTQADTKLRCQILSSLLPPVAEGFPDCLASFAWPHAFSPPFGCSVVWMIPVNVARFLQG